MLWQPKRPGALLCLASDLAVLLPIEAAQRVSPQTEREDFFEAHIRPVLTGTCFKCHGGEQVNHELRVDSREALLKGGESGPAVVPGDPERSLLIQAIRRTHADIKMPPKTKLADEVIGDFVTWVKDGAVWPKTTSARSQSTRSTRHWAFEPVKEVQPPKSRGRSAHPIDRFIEAKRRERGLKPLPLADKRTLARRVYFDLIGLPPTPDELDAFLNDKSPDAYAKLVDRLLGSPRYGERWGRHWMDVVRYADTAGDNADYPIPEARLYRDYIIATFNADKPYDEFVREQLAGDILAKQGPREKYAERVIATGLLAFSRRYATAPFELMHLTLEDSIETTGRTFMGLTLRCARCHDHKFDPVTKQDYYALYGFFASTQYPFAGSEEFESKKFPRSGFVPLVPAEEAELRLKTHQEKIASLEAELEKIEAEDPVAKHLGELKQQVETKSKQVQEAEQVQQNVEALKTELDSLKKRRDEADGKLKEKLKPLRTELSRLLRRGAPPDLPVAYAVCDGKPVDACVQPRGEPDQQGPVVKRRPPAFLAGDAPLPIPEGASGRLEFAQWLTRPDNPLTARVMVNRIWQHHFGQGIVATPSNFGLRGEAPTHPELLDYLAACFIEHGWSIKALHRLILTSKTYQLASSPPVAADVRRLNRQISNHKSDFRDGQSLLTSAATREMEIDPANKFYWRFDRRRLDAEAIRDAMLFVAGNLNLEPPAEHPFPKIEDWHWTQHNPFKAVYQSDRRSVYLMTQRIQRHPYLALFDAPDANTTTDVRSDSTVPLQALYLMNNPFVQAQATTVARRLLAARTDCTQRVRLACRLAWSREPSERETQRALDFIRRYRGQLEQAGAPAEQIETEAWTGYARVVLTANEFCYVD
ncbi:MAG: DUF1553 domain-containing protein [Verrucomicrobia bacterium]|nr:DUF1553 domain-containing protein [Verrucomicrobiota bacterium]